MDRIVMIEIDVASRRAILNTQMRNVFHDKKARVG